MKRNIIIFIILALLVVAGCDTEEAPTETAKVFLGGTDGVTASFEAFGVAEDGTYTIFDEDTFSIDVTLKNKGEYDVKAEEVKVNLLGPSQDEFTGITSWELKNSNIIDMKSELIPEGGEETIDFASEAKYKSKVIAFTDRVWFANIEYVYQTKLIIPEACLKEDLADERVCDVKGDKTFHVSGAPVTVTNVEDSVAGKGIMALKITVEKRGNGKVAQPDNKFSATKEEFAYTIDDEAWKCTSAGQEGKARLIEGKADIVCKSREPLEEGTLATKQISLTLDYKYQDLVQETLRIKESAK